MDTHPKAFTISEYIEELKRLQIEHGNLEVYAFDYDTNIRDTWPELSVDENKKNIILV